MVLDRLKNFEKNKCVKPNLPQINRSSLVTKNHKLKMNKKV